MPYRTPPPGGPIRDGHFEDFVELAHEVRKAARRLGLPATSADNTKALLIGFEVGHYRWTIRALLAARTCPEPLRGFLTTKAGRAGLARRMS